ncbi:uncharacterized protein P7C71_g6561, partial [Lecanoromycetidae sp. Uapishka_2]
MASKFSFLEATVMRRSTIDLKKDSTIPDSRIIEIVNHAILHTPSPFHVQSTRAVVLLHGDHDKFWDMAYAHAEKNYPPEMFQGRIVPNLKSFKGSYATVLFYDDPEAVNGMPPMLGNLIKSFPDWAEHSNGMAQYIAWTAFCAEGLGGNIQHYQKNGLTEKISAEWGLPAHWDLKAQMNIGTPNGPPRGGVEKAFADLEPRVKVFGKN